MAANKKMASRKPVLVWLAGFSSTPESTRRGIHRLRSNNHTYCLYTYGIFNPDLKLSKSDVLALRLSGEPYCKECFP